MSQPAQRPAAEDPGTDPRADGKFSINEDWAATILGLVLLVLALTRVIPPGLIP
ncbi:MAG TPA: hypothetical protein VFC82_02130 [Actinomycetaceae bacterium]|nr:hypothetical protein [Actinomycetaceae bacterium]